MSAASTMIKYNSFIEWYAYFAVMVYVICSPA